MSEAATAPVEASAAPLAATSLTAAAAAPADTGATSSPASGEGEAAAAAGQGTAAGETPDGGAPADGEAAGKEEGAGAQGAPDQYADFQLPEGYALEGEMLETVTAFAKAHNMTQEQAQALVDLGGKQAASIQSAYAQLAAEKPVVASDHWAKAWSEQTTADKELGGKNLTDTMAKATRVFQTFGTPELAEFLGQTGLAHHPELIRFMHKVGQAVSEDVLVVPSGSQGGGPKRGENPAKVLYPSMA